MSFLNGIEPIEKLVGAKLKEYDAFGQKSIQLGDELKPLVAEYERDGVDLKISDVDSGDFIVLKQYFASFPSADLMTSGGAKIEGATVSKLAGPGPVAQSSTQNDASPIGQIEDLSGTVTIKHADGTSEQAFEGTPVFKGDILETENDGDFSITFIDDTKFSMGPNGRAVLDEMIYNDQNTANNGMGISLLQGVFTFVSGKVAKDDPESVSIKTPVGTIGIRGTSWSGKVAQIGEESLFTLFTGAIVVANEAGSQLLTLAKQSVILVSSTVAPSQPFVLTDEQLIDAYGKVLSLINPDWWKEDEEGFDPSQINPQAGPGNGGSGGGGAGFSGPNLAQLGDGLGLSGILELSDLLDETDLTEDELRQLLDPLRDPTAPDIEVRVVTITDPETSTVSAFNIEVLLDVPAPETVTIFYEIQPGTATGIDNGAPGDVDFLDEGGGVIVIPAGSTAGTFSIVLVDDDVIENTEFFIVQLTDAINANIDPLASSALIVIEDDDVGVISIQPVVPEPVLVPAAFALLAAPSALASESDVEIEEGTGAVEFKFILDKAVAPGVEVRVDYVVTGEGVARTGLNEGEVYSATFSGGESGLQPGSELIVSIDILDDDLYQGDQDFVIQIVGGSSNSEADEADNTLSVTVIDDETPVIVGEGEEGTVSEDEIDDSDLALSLGISGGSGAFQSLVFSNDQSDFDAYGLSSAGIPITLTGLGSSEVIGKAGGVEIFKVVLNSDGTYNLYLSGPLDHPVGEGHSPDVDPISLNFDVVDENGSSTSGSVSFTVEDDVPFAYSDVDTVAEGGVATGNVLTGTETTGDANETDGTADDAGADGISIVSANLFSSEETPETPDESGTIEVTGLYGVLTLYADGRYSYQANDGLDNDIAVVERFTYTIEDGDGDKSSAEITIGIEDALTPEIGSVADVSLDEDDLPEGSDQTKEPVTAGAEIPITFNGDDPGAVTLDISGLPDVTSQGDPVEYTIETLEDGVTQRVTATAVPEEGTPREVFVLDFAPNGNGENYSYSVTLADVLDHPNEGEDEIVFSFGVDLEDQDGSSVSGGFDFKVVDDTPVATSDLEEVVTVPKPCFNLVFVLDTSGSMNSFVPGATEENPTTYMDVLRESVVKLLGSYDEVGIGFNLTFIDFDSDAEVVFSGTSIEDAIVFVENASNLVPGGATNYAAALANDADGAQGVLTGHLANPDLDDFFNTVYFISDGAPFPSSSQVPLGDNLENPWQLFVDGNDIEVISVGIGENLDVEQLNRVENSGDEATVIVDANELETELEETVPEVKEGNIVSSGIVDRFGADGATVAYISFLASDEDLLVLYEDEGANIVEVFDGVFRVEFNIPQDGTELIVDLPYGSEFSIDSSGNYVFEAAAGVPAGTEHKFEYVLVDGDLDTDSAELKFLFINEGDEPIVVIGPDDTGIETVGDEAANVLAGDALNDTLSGEGGDDTLIGGGGDDSLEGGAGADTFEITEADGGNIIIADMDVAEDLVSLDGLFDALSISTEDRDQGEAWELEIVSGFATLTVTAPNGPSITFENIVDPGAEDLSQLASRIIVGDES